MNASVDDVTDVSGPRHGIVYWASMLTGLLAMAYGVRGYGRREANPSALPLDYGGNLRVALAARRGAAMLTCSVFDRVPGEGRWPTVLLLDGSIGIGGDPLALLRRVRTVLAPRGLALVELLAPGSPSKQGAAQLETETGAYTTIPWARLGVDELDDVADASGFLVEDLRRIGRRWFGWLRSDVPD